MKTIDINNLSLSDFGDLMQSRDSTLDNLSNPECPVDKAVSGFDCDKAFALSEEKSKSSGHVAT